MRKTSRSRFSFAWILLCLALAVTGLGQMPIFKRYYIADLPGMAWTADYGLTHMLHYLFAALFLGIAGAWVGRRMFDRSWTLTPLGRIRLWVVGVVAATGLVRVAKNMPDVWFSPEVVLLVDWTHLFAVVAFGVLALVSMSRKSAYEEGARY